MLNTVDKIRALPPELQAQVAAFVDFLWERRTEAASKKGQSQARRKPKFKWAGALADLGDQYTSVELQHEISQR